jgi:hypothetical protein
MSWRCWNSVTVYGPDAEIERFRRTCLSFPEGSDPDADFDGWNGREAEIGVGAARREEGLGFPERAVVDVSNYREEEPGPGSWSFRFDTRHSFPERELDRIASSFPSLHFECECIGSLDEFMGFGWFNPPPRGEAFRQDLPVRPTHWEDGGCKREPAAEARHQLLIAGLIQAACSAPRGRLDS